MQSQRSKPEVLSVAYHDRVCRALCRLEWPRLRVAALLLALLAWSPVLLPAQETEAPTSKQDGKKSDSAKPDQAKSDAIKRGKKALAAAAKLADVPAGTEYEQRQQAIEKAIEAYAACVEAHAAVPPIVAEAEFRRGQLFAKLQQVEPACAAFERAASLHAEVFGARAWLEKAHTERRAKRYADALESYRRASGLAGANYAGQAKLWVGKTLVTLGRLPDARAAFVELARDAKADAKLRVQAYDEAAMTWIRDRNAAATAKLHDEVETTFATEVAGDSKAAIALKRSIERMRSKKSLERMRAQQG